MRWGLTITELSHPARHKTAVVKNLVGAALFFAFVSFLAPSQARDGSLQLSDVQFVQFLLVWTGDYSGIVDGIAGPQTRAAMEAFFARRFRLRPEAVADEHIQVLLEDAATAIAKSGFSLRRDSELDVTFGVPEALVQPTVSTDARRRLFRSQDRTLELEVAYLSNRYVSLDQLYRRLTTISGRTVSYSRFQPSWFVLAGNDGGRRFYARYHRRGADIRGFSVSYSAERAVQFEPIVVAMSNVFRPSATASDPLITFLDDLHRPDDQTEEHPRISPVPEQPPAPSQDADKPRADSSGSGFVVDAKGHVLTNAHVVADCVTLVVGVGSAAKLVVADAVNDLALLESTSARKAPALVFRSDSIRLGEEVIAAGFPLHGVLADSINVTLGVVSSLSGPRNDSRFIQTTAPIQPGNSGGPLIDRGGKVVGVVTSKLDAVIALERGGFIPEGVNFAIRHDTIRSFLDANRVDYRADIRGTDRQSIEDIADSLRRSVIPIECRAGS